MTTLFREVLTETKNYIETHDKIKKYLGLKKHTDILSQDFITTFLWKDDINFAELTRILFFNLLYEFASKQDTKVEKFMKWL